MSFSGEFIFLKLYKGFFLDSCEVLLFHLINTFLELLVLVLDCLDVRGDYYLFSIYSVLMVLMEVTLLSKLLPGRLCVFS
jgi:hypothetical protein